MGQSRTSIRFFCSTHPEKHPGHECHTLKWMRALQTRVFGASIARRSGLQLVCPCRSSKIMQAPAVRIFRACPFGSAPLRQSTLHFSSFYSLLVPAPMLSLFGPRHPMALLLGPNTTYKISSWGPGRSATTLALRQHIRPVPGRVPQYPVANHATSFFQSQVVRKKRQDY